MIDSTPSHRIAQCSSVRVTILEGDPLPIQVDGEAWLQRPGVIQIKHKVKGSIGFNDLKFSFKNRVHMLAKAKQGNPARDEVIDLTDEEIELLSKHFKLLKSACSRFVRHFEGVILFTCIYPVIFGKVKCC